MAVNWVSYAQFSSVTETLNQSFAIPRHALCEQRTLEAFKVLGLLFLFVLYLVSFFSSFFLPFYGKKTPIYCALYPTGHLTSVFMQTFFTRKAGI